ncbi:COMM domain-containing protein 4 [Chamberlinius hualienensis]
MKFRFCGDLDCPDWTLAEIATLSKLTSIKLRLLCSLVVKDILGIQEIDYSKAQQLTSDAKFEISDIKASVAVIHFILCSATKHGVDEESLSCEIQQLGLPKEHATSLCKIYAENYTQVRNKLLDSSLRYNEVDYVRWRVDYLISSSHLKNINEPAVQLCFKTKNGDKPIAFSVTPKKLQLLLSECKQIQHLISALED